MERQKQAYSYAILAVLLWSTVASAFKISLRYLDYLQLLFVASLVSLVILFIILTVQKRLRFLVHYSFGDYFNSALLGILNPFLYYVVLFKAYSLLPAQEAQPLNYTWSITLVLFSIPLLKQKIGLVSIFALIVSYFGVFIISTRGNILGFKFTNPYGVALALGSAVIWALFWIYNVRDKRDEPSKLFLNFAFGFLFILIAMILSSRIKILPPMKGIAGGIYVGLFEMGITFVLWLKALSLSKTTAQVSNLIYLSPFVSLVLIRFVVGEVILLSTIVGLVFIVGGIIIQQYDSRRLVSKNR
jgi:drug/metabolite transporter (DMT)-like permease